MRLVIIKAAVSAVGTELRGLRTLLHDLRWFKATVIGVGVWAFATAAFAATVGVGAIGIDGLACARPGEMFPTLYDTDAGWDLWFNTPWTFTVAVVCIAVSMRCAQYIGLRTVKAIAYCSLPLQAWWWHGLLVLRECS